MRPLQAELLAGTDLHRRVVGERMLGARRSLLIATANVKAMFVPQGGAGRYRSILDAFDGLARRGVALRLLHAEVPSRPFRAAFDRKRRLTEGALALKICPRVHFKAVIVDGSWIYLGSANLTGAGLGAKDEHRRNFELGVCTEDFDTIDRVTALFEAVWTGAECGRCKLRAVCPDPIGPAIAPERRRRASASRAPSLVQLGRARRIDR